MQFTFFIRFLHSLKKKEKNKARVEGSIYEAHLVEETSTFALFYYRDHVETRRTRITRNLVVSEGSSCNPSISIFNYLGRAIGKSMTYYLNQRDMMFPKCMFFKIVKRFNHTLSKMMFTPFTRMLIMLICGV